MTTLATQTAYEQLAGLWACDELDGYDPEGATLPFYLWAIAALEDRTDVTSLHDFLVESCGLTATLDEFIAFSGFQIRSWPFPHKWNYSLTLGELAVWIQEHSDRPDMSPLRIAGTTCPAGGVFLGMVELLKREDIDETIRRSTPIFEVLKPYQLANLLVQTQVATRRAAPILHHPLENFYLGYGCLLPLAGFVCLYVFHVGGGSLAAIVLAFLMLASIASLLLLEFVIGTRPYEEFLPKGVRTFGDLARRIVLQPTY